MRTALRETAQPVQSVIAGLVPAILLRKAIRMLKRSMPQFPRQLALSSTHQAIVGLGAPINQKPGSLAGLLLHFLLGVASLRSDRQ